MEQNRIILYAITITLAIIIVAMVGAMLYGLFDLRVDNKAIFAIIGPAFQTVIGVFCGILGGRALGKDRT